jgi:class 3 adenylate cyclase
MAEYYRAQDRRVMEMNQPEYHIVETKQKTANEQTVWLDVNKIPIHDSRGNVIGILGVLEDITQRQQAEAALRAEQEKSERLLLNILPKAIADQLKRDNSAIAEQFNEVTILFADLVDFTPLASQISPTKLVNLLNEIFSIFDQLAEQHNLEKIKTIGDAYMVVGGLPTVRPNHAEAIAEMALDMQREIARFKRDDGEPFRLRIGINTGSVVAGVIGIKKFIYDLWGDAVNVASRMETQGSAGNIQVTATTYKYLKDKYLLEERGTILVKGKGEMMTYWLTGRKDTNS